jgi:hypothetical protein
MRALLIPAALGTVAVAGCGLGDDGPRTSQSRDVAAFTRIDSRGSVDVRLRVGGPQRVRVTAGENVIDDVHTDVRDGTLRVTFDHDGFGGDNVVVDASVERLEGVDASGSGNVDAEGIASDAFEVRTDGSGDVALGGTTGRLIVDLDGSGNADLAALAARKARVSVGGSGDAEVRAAEKLAVTVDGSGDVRYYGEPALSQKVDGSGDVTHAN